MAAKRRPAAAGDTAAQAKRRFDRSQEQEAVTGIKAHRTGSSGTQLFMSRVEKRTWEEIEPQAVHVGDLAAVFGDIRKTMSKTMIGQLTVPGAYQHEFIDMADACAMGFVFVRCYLVPRRPFMQEVGGDALNGEAA